MYLDDLAFSNFMGFKKQEIDFSGENTSIYGDNGTGKTTVFTGYTWLLFGKDSQGKTDFDIKTLKNGKPIHGLDYAVEGAMDVDGKTVKLKKVMRENWTTARGKATAIFSGHTISHYIDDVPVPQKDYLKKVAEICDEKLFRLLSDVRHFNEIMSWKERRGILFSLVDDVTDDEVFETSSKLQSLKKLLGDKTMEDYAVMQKARTKEIKEEKAQIPTRIDEATILLPDLTGIDGAKLGRELVSTKDKIKEAELSLSRIATGGEVAEKQKRLAELEASDIRQSNQAAEESVLPLKKKRVELEARKDDLASFKRSLESLNSGVGVYAKQLAENEEARNVLRARWRELNAKTFELEQGENCPTCGQPLPVEQLALARQKAEADFNQQKAEQITAINAEGGELKERAAELMERKSSLELEIKKAKISINDAELIVESLEMSIEKMKEDSVGAVATKNPETEKIKKEIEDLQKGSTSEADSLREEIARLEALKANIERGLGDIDRNTKGKARIEELKAEERRLAGEVERLEKELFLIEDFTKTKCEMLEGRINSLFSFAQFRLFRTQINEGMKEVCDTLGDGVPYNSMNNASRINCGLDIINVLSKHYGLLMPVFVDNAESVVELMPTQNQLIRLIVSEADKKLRVETGK